MMDNNTRTKEGGSVITFVVVGIILAVLVIGGVFTVHKSGQEKPLVSPSKSTQPSTSISPSKTPTATTQPSRKPSPTPVRPPVTSTAPKTSLPTTGPADNVVHMLMIAGLIGVSVAYVQSYRARRTQLIRQQVD